MTTYIKAGYGFNVGYDFSRAKEAVAIEIDSRRKGYAYGYIKGDPQSPLGFMRADRVRVQVPLGGIDEGYIVSAADIEARRRSIPGEA